MNLKSLGQTGLNIPEVGLGTWNYYGGVEPLRVGIEQGALLIDTAESYGSEPVIGEAIRGIREQVILATKVSPEHFRYPEIMRAVDESLCRLGTDYIDLYQLHHPNSNVPIDETLGAMEDLVDAGKVRFIGVSNFCLTELKEAQQVMRKQKIVANQVRYNLIDRTIERELLRYCQANHVSIIAYSPLSRDFQRIFDCDSKGVLFKIAKATGKTPAQVAINWCLCKEGVFVIPKGNSIGHVVENCAASGWRLEAKHLRLLDENIKFRCRSRLEILLRRLVPGSLRGLALAFIRGLPRGVRRRFS